MSLKIGKVKIPVFAIIKAIPGAVRVTGWSSRHL